VSWDNNQVIGFDVETSGTKPEYALQPWRVATGDAWVTSFVWRYYKDGEWLVVSKLFPSKDDMRAMLEFAIREQRSIVGWFVQFDIQWLIAYGLEDLVFRVFWLDGYLLWKHYDVDPEYDIARARKRSYSLKTCVREFLPEFAGYEEEIDFHSTDPDELKKLAEYNEMDVALTITLAKRWFNLLTPAQLQAAVIEAHSIPHVALANLRGLPIDIIAAAELQAHLNSEAAYALRELEPYGATEKVLASSKQLGELMFGKWGLEPVVKTATGANSTGKETLHELALVDVRAEIVKAFRDANGNRTKFADTPLASALYNGDGCAHPQARMFGTYSGRMTYSSDQPAREVNPKTGKERNVDLPTGFALHQIKRGPEYRSILCAPLGYRMVEFDAASQEFRWMAVASGDETMLGLCQPGEDAHSFMGAAIARVDYRELIRRVHTGDKVAKAQRQLGKIANLCMAAGTQVLTDRGPCSIEHVRADDLVWDGQDFVSHDGVVCSGYKVVVNYDSLTATPEHKVLVDGDWVEIRDAARHGWRIEPALGEGWPRQFRSTVRIVDGLVRRTLSEIGGALCSGALRLWSEEGRQSAVHGNGALGAVQGVRYAPAPHVQRPIDLRDSGRQDVAEACERMVSTLQQSIRQVLPQLRRAWDRVSLCLRQGGGGVGQGASSTPHLQTTGHRPSGQRRPLRAWQLALGYATAEPCEPHKAWVYDIVNCGPRHRFAANGKIVHNSLQYRTSAKKLLFVARVQYGLNMTIEEAQDICDTYHRTYPGVRQYWARQIDQTQQTGYVETFAGRRVTVLGDWGGALGWSMGSTSINYRIQGTGADQKYLAMAALAPVVRNMGGRFAFDLHDGLIFYVKEDIPLDTIMEMRAVLDSIDYEEAWGFKSPVPMPWDAKWGFSYGTLEEIK
jgi:DNA polymerase I-like protein with 3'-5' exonuclease and polymerase domains